MKHRKVEVKYAKEFEGFASKALDIIEKEYDETDRIDSAEIDKDPSSGKVVLKVAANRGNVGNGTIESLYALD